MSFHAKSELGVFAQSGLMQYADINGMIPEAGDTPETMAYESGHWVWDSPTPIDWESDPAWTAFRAGAIEATRKASEALAEWNREQAR